MAFTLNAKKEARIDGPGKHRHALLRVDPSFIVDASTGLGIQRVIRVTRNALPDDVELVNVRYAGIRLMLVIYSSAFDEAEYGLEPTVPPPEFTIDWD